MKTEAEITKTLLLDIIKLCEDWQNADIEGKEIEPWMEHTDKAIMTIVKTACAALPRIE